MPGWFGCRDRKSPVAQIIAARLPFMSALPLPRNRPSSSVALNGGVRQASSGPGGTTSVCPANRNDGHEFYEYVLLQTNHALAIGESLEKMLQDEHWTSKDISWWPC